MVDNLLPPFPRKSYQHQSVQSFQNLGQSAQNVLVFYGEDGLGKTTLRKLLENEYRAQSVVLNGAAMKQFNDTGSDNAIALIYNQLKQDGILLKGFYRVYAYWSEWARLGQSFDPNNLAERVDKGDMISTAGDILSQVHPAIGLVSKLAWFLLRFPMEYRQQKEILQELNDCSEPYELRQKLPRYLMQTLQLFLQDHDRRVAVLIDGYEDLLDQQGRCLWLEEMMAVDSPSVLWVLFAKDAIAALPQAKQIKLEPLDYDESLEWVRSLGVIDQEIAQTIAIAAKGIPFDLKNRVELYRKTQQTGATSREQVLQQLLGELEQAALEMLRRLAVARTWDEELFGAIAQSERFEDEQTLLNQVLASPYVESVGASLWRLHPLMGQHLQQQLSESELAAIHQELSVYARSRYSQEAVLERLSDAVYHGLRGTDPEAAGEWALQQVATLQAEFHHLEEIALIQFVTEMDSRLSVELGAIAAMQLGVSQVELGQGAAAIVALEQAKSIWALLENPPRSEVATVEFYLGRAYLQAGRIFDAQNAALRAKTLRTTLFGAESLAMAEVLSLLARVLMERDREREALALNQKALEIYAMQPEGESLASLRVQRSQVSLLCAMNRLDDGLRLCRSALEVAQTLLGAEHPEVVLWLEQLGAIYEGMGRHKFVQAFERYEQALAIGEPLLGADHPLVLYLLKGLTRICRKLGQTEAAEEFAHRHNANVQIGTFDDTVEAARRMNNLAYSLWKKGEYGKAEPLWVRSLAIHEQVLGATHPNTASSLNNLALLYNAQGRYREAESLYVRSLAIYEQELSATHPNTASSLNNLAGLYNLQERYSEAEPLFVRSLAIREQQLGATHPDTAESLNNLAALYGSQGRYREAEPLLARSIEIAEKALGANHPDTQLFIQNLELMRQKMRSNSSDSA